MSNTNMTLFQGGNKVTLKGAKKMVAALRDSSHEGASGDLPDGGVYISFSGKMGRYSIGMDKEDADPKEVWLVNVFQFEGGWMCWKGGTPVAKRLGSIFGEPVPTPDFSEHGPFNERNGEGWFKAKAMMLRSLDSGRQGYFSTTTKSAVREFARIEGEIARRLEAGLPAWPVLQLEKEQFKAQGNTNWKPKFEVVGWLAMQQVQKMAQMEDAQEILNALGKLLKEAERMEERGILDSTLSDDDAEDQTSEDQADDLEDDVEDAEIVDEASEDFDEEDDFEVEDEGDFEEEEDDFEEEEDEDEEAAEAERLAAEAAAKAARIAAKKAAAQKTGGLRRRPAKA